MSATADVRLGALRLRPLEREICGPGGTVSIEPKVMQVLLALASREGSVVTRDWLVQSCWDGRAVSEDAITRVISKIRALSRDIAEGEFTIETISGVGYRLKSVAGPAGVPPQPVPPTQVEVSSRVWRKRRLATPWLGLVGVVLVVGLVLVSRAVPNAPNIHAPAATIGGPGGDPAARDLAMRARAGIFEGDPVKLAEAVAFYREQALKTPGDGGLWGQVALTHALRLGQSSPAERPALEARLREAAYRAEAIDPSNSHARAALAVVEPTFRNWMRKDVMLRDDLLANQETATLFQRYRFLATVGRTREAEVFLSRAAAQSPLIPWVRAAWIDMLVEQGRFRDAELAGEQAARLWPREPRIWFSRFFLAVLSGRPKDAEALAAGRTGIPPATYDDDVALAGQFARAVAEGPQGARAKVMAAYRRMLDRGRGDVGRALKVAMVLGNVDSAYALAQRLYLRGDGGALPSHEGVAPFLPGDPDTATLFGPGAERTLGRPALHGACGAGRTDRLLAPHAHTGHLQRDPDFAALCRRRGSSSAIGSRRGR